ncbi:chromate transporter [Natranaerobius thermophilus]|nr:chromate transporter [Natranaerobius thermophilus]
MIPFSVNNIYLKLFLVFFRLGAFTFGGGYAMLPLIKREIVEKNSWLDEQEFLNTIAITQSIPGALAVNTAIYIGYNIRGYKGAISSLLGVILPSFLIILTIVSFLFRWQDHHVVERVFQGIRPGVVGLIIAAVYKIGKPLLAKNKVAIPIFILALGLALLGVHPIILILSFGLIGVLVYRKGES